MAGACGSTIHEAWLAVSAPPNAAGFTTAADLRMRGFAFVGSTTMYAHMQAIGMVNDHLVSCFRWPELGGQT